jgi:hypothetical protein
MHPKFADRIARRLSVTKRLKGITAVSGLAHQLMGYCGEDHPDYILVKQCLAKYKGNLNTVDTQ